jgi:hypothetical protein
MLENAEEKRQVTEEVEEKDGALSENWRRGDSESVVHLPCYILNRFLDLFHNPGERAKVGLSTVDRHVTLRDC